MNSQNHYCCRCHRTTKFMVQGDRFTCSSCGVVIEKDARSESEERNLIGNPMRSYKTNYAA